VSAADVDTSRDIGRDDRAHLYALLCEFSEAMSERDVAARQARLDAFLRERKAAWEAVTTPEERERYRKQERAHAVWFNARARLPFVRLRREADTRRRDGLQRRPAHVRRAPRTRRAVTRSRARAPGRLSDDDLDAARAQESPNVVLLALAASGPFSTTSATRSSRPMSHACPKGVSGAGNKLEQSCVGQGIAAGRKDRRSFPFARSCPLKEIAQPVHRRRSRVDARQNRLQSCLPLYSSVRDLMLFHVGCGLMTSCQPDPSKRPCCHD
jgi:hypothetical protein